MRSLRRHVAPLTVAMSFSLLALPLMAADARPTATPASPYIDECPAEVSSVEQGLWIQLDTDTGQLRRTLSQQSGKAASRDLSLSKSADGLDVVVHADGRQSVNLQGRFQSAMVARVNADGSSSFACVDTAAAAEGFVRATTSTPSTTIVRSEPPAAPLAPAAE